MVGLLYELFLLDLWFVVCVARSSRETCQLFEGLVGPFLHHFDTCFLRHVDTWPLMTNLYLYLIYFSLSLSYLSFFYLYLDLYLIYLYLDLYLIYVFIFIVILCLLC